jgi:hypothetical protein
MGESKEGQEHWNEDYAYSYIKLSLLGANNINSLTECTKVPMPNKASGVREIYSSQTKEEK